MKLKNLKTNFLGRNNFYYNTIDSTQKEIWRRIYEENIENGTLIFSDYQTSGIGTHGRKWYTDEKNNISFSFFINMDCDIKKISGLTLEIAKTIKEILKRKYNVEIQIKEPNDIYYNGKKIGGILTESKVFSNKIKYLVVGIGINTNKQYFVDNIKDIATSIIKEFGIIIDTGEFITEFCNEFEKKIIIKGEKNNENRLFISRSRLTMYWNGKRFIRKI